ncbi:hypothetical protein BH24ACT22_BH24ACT22_16780 [soil metagenome]
MQSGRRWLRLGLGALLLLAALGVLVLSVVLHVRYGGGTLERISADSMDVHADFDTFFRSAEVALAGGDVYNTGARLVNLNPPIWTVLMLPFTFMEPLDAYRLFGLISLFMMLGSAAWMAGELRLRAGWAVVAVGVVLFSSPMLATLALGQMYPVLVLGLVAAWVMDRRGKYLLAGLALGLVMALKPSLAPLILWPAVRKRWDMTGTTIISGAVATLVGSLVLGPYTTIRYAEVVLKADIDGFWDNASLASVATRTFTDTRFAEPLAILPWSVVAAYVVGIALIIVTAVKIRGGSEAGLWALISASLLASPIAWNNYLLLLAPGILLLLARGRIPLAFLLLALQFIPQQYPSLWNESDTVLATLALSSYMYVLAAHWLSFVTVGKESRRAKRTTFVEEPTEPDRKPAQA